MEFIKENLPLIVIAGVTLRGESLRGTELQLTGTGSQVKTVSITTNVSGGTNGTYNYVHQCYKFKWCGFICLML